MQEESINVFALNKDRQTVAIAIPFSNLQWQRRYYSAGEFEIEIPLSVYDGDWAYIGISGRPEIGMVQKIYITGDNEVHVQLSGFFVEKMLDFKVCYPRFIYNNKITEDTVRTMFTKYKGDIPITLGAANSPKLGNATWSDFVDDYLGTKMYSILESREMSYRVILNDNNQFIFQVWQGVDRSPNQDVNAQYAFSELFGNIKSKNVDMDESAYRNYAIIPCNANDDDVEQNVYYVNLAAKDEYLRQMVINMRSSHPDEDQTMADFESMVKQEATEKLLANARIEDISIDMLAESGYMVDYDLGDKCVLTLQDIGVELTSRIVEVKEVFKQQGHTISVGLGNKRMTNIRRAIAAL